MYRLRKANKYGNTTKEYNGRWYHSKLEAKYAQELDLMKKAKEIKDWIPQFKLSLDVNGKHITNYYVDFLVTNNDNSQELWEIKGFETDTWRMKWRLATALYHDQYEMIVIKQ